MYTLLFIAIVLTLGAWFFDPRDWNGKWQHNKKEHSQMRMFFFIGGVWYEYHMYSISEFEVIIQEQFNKMLLWVHEQHIYVKCCKEHCI